MPASARPGRPLLFTVGVLVAAMALLAGACSDDSSDDGAAAEDDATTTTAANEADPELAPPDEPGPYAVGRVTLDLVDPLTERPLVTDVWYPADAGTTGEPSVYEFIPGISYPSELALAGVPVAADAPFPLVVYSHGSGGLRYIASYFTELLASHGFVVAAVDHVGNTAIEAIAGGEPSNEQIAVDRLGDTTALITELLAVSDQPPGDDPLAATLSGSIDADRIGVTGHSFGGVHRDSAPSAGSRTSSRRSPPTTASTRSLRSPRRPASSPTRSSSPSTSRRCCSLAPRTRRRRSRRTPSGPWELIAGRPLWRVDLVDAGHQSFTDVCAYQELLPTLPDVPDVFIEVVDGFAEEGCTEDLMPIEQAHAPSNSALVSFLSAYVAGEEGYVAFLEQAEPGEVVEVKN